MARGKKSKTRKSRARQTVTLQERFVQYLNDALAVENATIPRLEARIKQTGLADAKGQLQHHLEETREQQSRLQQVISSLGGRPAREQAQLPIPSPPKRMSSAMKLIPAEQELKGAKEDAIIENAEVVMYDTLVQLAQQANVSEAIPALTQNLNEEKEMADWIRANTPAMIAQLYPQIESSFGQQEKEEEKEREQDMTTAATTEA